MRRRIGSIVEGHGEVGAVPILLQRWLAHVGRSHEFQVLPPVRVGVDKLKNPLDVQRQQGIEYAVRTALRNKPDALLVVLDADKECAQPSRTPPLGPTLLKRARSEAPHIELAVVVADPEYEAWFLRNAPSIFPGVLEAQPVKRDCKALVTGLLGTNYLEAYHQAQLTKALPLPAPDAIAAMPDVSYRKLFKELARLIPP